MAFTSLVWTTLLASVVLAAPAPNLASRTIAKRATPVIGPGFTAQETQQLTDAISDAIELAAYAVRDYSGTDTTRNKYFQSSDKDTVNKVLLNIIGGDALNPVGNSLLADISIVVDYPNPAGVIACDGDTMAEMRDWNTDNPKIVVCAGAGFGHGGIGRGYGDPQHLPAVGKIDCGYLQPRVSWRMETLGSILLHEYTHWKKLVVPPLQKETDDDAYDPIGTRNLDKTKALNNADSYSWFATENLWSVLCQTTYADPQQFDGDDPNCASFACKAPKGPGP